MIESLMQYLADIGPQVAVAFVQTLQMVILSVIFSHILGIPLGIILVTTSPGHILENKFVNLVLGAVINAARSLPFIILLVAIIPFTRAIVGSSIGTMGATVPLTVGAIPFVARMVETSLKEIEWGIIEAALSMGATPWQIITKVLLPEAMASLILGATITTITLIGYSAMAGFVGGGGLGDLAMRFGYYRREDGILLITIIILIVMVQLIQMLGESLSGKVNKK
ncbi:methionine ABC transporter permease MetI [Zhaonella formicivorans]|uniref:methionine ABC transporter permease MetI n=1 Tax=Zhaonella formicivorans TaxID=2528593 RepID=UPI0010D32806